MMPLFIAAWLTITPPAHLISDSTAVFLLEFQQSVSNTYLLNVGNYSIYDDNNQELQIYSAELLSSIDGIPVLYTKLLALKTAIPEQKKLYNIDAFSYGVRSYFNNGFAPNLELQPVLMIK
jgi:hypothetical protein